MSQGTVQKTYGVDADIENKEYLSLISKYAQNKKTDKNRLRKFTIISLPSGGDTK